MIKLLTHDPIFLSLKSEVATKEDSQVAQDLLDTLIAHKDSCVGMAANMIGVRKRIIAFDNNGTYMVMFNPEIIKKSEPYETEEGCLSLFGGPRKPELIDPCDAIVRVTMSSICSSDLHIKHGSVPRAVPGITVGHEMVGIVESVGSGVTKFKPGDRVTVNVETFCGECFSAKKAM